MNTFAENLKHSLLSMIDEMEFYELDCFVHNPDKDFKRQRKFTFSSVMRFILSMGSASLGQELLKYFHYNSDFPSVSAFVQQRQKIKPEAFFELFRRFSLKHEEINLFREYRLLAVDGSDISLPLNPSEPFAFPESKCSMLHLNALFDIMSRQYVDAIIQGKHESNETAAIVTMTDRLPDQYPVIIVADRGYENYNFFAHVEERFFDYVVRLRTSKSRSMFAGLKLPDGEPFDITKNIVITRHSTGPYAVDKEKYKYMTKQSRFDFIPDCKHPDYEMLIRFVSFPLNTGEFEVLATSLPESEFPVSVLKEIYNLRWGIETSFRELKHVVGLAAFHTKKADCAMQEIYARLIMYNFSLLIAGKVMIPEQPCRKYRYLINFAQAIRICIEYFRIHNSSPPFDLQALLSRFILPERKGRTYIRKVYPQGAKAFNYRLT